MQNQECLKKNKIILYDFINEIWNKKNHNEDVFSVISDQIICNAIVGKSFGKKAFLDTITSWAKAFPDYKQKILKFEQYGNVINCQAFDTGCHLGIYSNPSHSKSKNFESNSIGYLLTKKEPTKKEVKYHIDLSFVFIQNKIILCQMNGTDTVNLAKQLGLVMLTNRSLKNRLFHQEEELIQILQNQSHPHLTKKEVTCLCFYLQGHSAKQIGQMLKISYRTVQTHIDRALMKLDCNSKFQFLENTIQNEAIHLWRHLYNLLLEDITSSQQSYQDHKN